jgi:glycosyltransferase involved in cell wall biosynthesis
MHILIVPSEHLVTARYPLGGVFQLHQATALRRAGHQVGILATGLIPPRFVGRPYSYRAAESIDGVQVQRQYRRTLMVQRFATCARLVRVYSELGLDAYEHYRQAFGSPAVVHAHNGSIAGVIARTIQRTDGTPYVLTEHSSAYAAGALDDAWARALLDCITSAQAFTVVSRSLAADVRRVLDRPAMTIGVLPNVLDPCFGDQAVRVERQRSGAFTFLSVGSLDHNKNHSLLLHAFGARFRQSDIRLRVGGSGRLRRRLEVLARDLGVATQVDFLGLLSRQRVMEEMQRADCVVLSSNYETFGVVLIEALACGTPVIATQCGGPEDIVTAGNGLLVPPGDASSLGTAMAEMIGRRGRFAPDVLRRDCLERFGERAFVASVEKYYERACA